jgi:transposase
VSVVRPGSAAFLALEARLAEMEARVREQAAEIQELKRQLKQNSRNSSLPPSSDPPYVKRRPKKKSGRKRGAQPGHEPHQRSLLPLERVDAFEDHVPSTCRHCQAALSAEDEVGTPERRQTIELPEIRAVVTEHRLHRRRGRGAGRRRRRWYRRGSPRR